MREFSPPKEECVFSESEISAPAERGAGHRAEFLGDSLAARQTMSRVYRITPRYQRWLVNGDSLSERNFRISLACWKNSKAPSPENTARATFHTRYNRLASVTSRRSFLSCRPILRFLLILVVISGNYEKMGTAMQVNAAKDAPAVLSKGRRMQMLKKAQRNFRISMPMQHSVFSRIIIFLTFYHQRPKIFFIGMGSGSWSNWP